MTAVGAQRLPSNVLHPLYTEYARNVRAEKCVNDKAR